MLQDILVTGLVNGGVYALLAIGFSLIFGVARIVNIAHTAFYMLAAYCFYALLVKVGLGFVPSALIAVVGVTLLAVLCYRLVIEPVREHEAAVLIATIALALIFQELMLLSFGGHYLGIPSTLEGTLRFAMTWRIAPLSTTGATSSSGAALSAPPDKSWRWNTSKPGTAAGR